MGLHIASMGLHFWGPMESQGLQNASPQIKPCHVSYPTDSPTATKLGLCNSINPFSKKTSTYTFYKHNAMAANDLVQQETRATAAMVLA